MESVNCKRSIKWKCFKKNFEDPGNKLEVDIWHQVLHKPKSSIIAHGNGVVHQEGDEGHDDTEEAKEDPVFPYSGKCVFPYESHYSCNSLVSITTTTPGRENIKRCTIILLWTSERQSVYTLLPVVQIENLQFPIFYGNWNKIITDKTAATPCKLYKRSSFWKEINMSIGQPFK